MKFLLTLVLNLCFLISFAQQIGNEELKKRIETYKQDIRGPYKEIRWYCPDGTIIPPQQRCPMPGGVQRARMKDEVTNLEATNHLYLGQILSTSSNDSFWDADYYNSRLKQYMLEKYLQAIDDGWVLRKAQYYRGAFQAEDEEQWGLNFFIWVLKEKIISEKQFFLIRQAARDIPHKGDNNLKQNIRANSKLISDAYTPFLDLRVKIHGQPDISDLDKVIAFRESHRTKMNAKDLELMDQLIEDMKKEFAPFSMNSLNQYLADIPKETELYKLLKKIQKDFDENKQPEIRVSMLSQTLLDLRKSFLNHRTPAIKLAILDVSIMLEDLLFREQSKVKFNSLEENLINIASLGIAATGCGYLELWEWEHLKNRLSLADRTELNQVELMQVFLASRNIVEWGTSMFMAVFEDVVHQYQGFESKSEGFVDDKVRSSILLQAGLSVAEFRNNISEHLPVANNIADLKNVEEARGLNPGFAKGELVVLSGNLDNVAFDANKIYIMNKPPSDLKPVAGIATVSEGNPVSHVQLLARNLGIPNAVISMNLLEDLKKYSGKTIFYAVSSRGTVILKLEEQMNKQENTLFLKNKRDESKITVPTEKINLEFQEVANLREIDATSSGKLCGPKAANLGQLKKLFPNHVVEGLVIPFGIFRDHLNQSMPDQTVSYWQYLNDVFDQAANLRTLETPTTEIEQYMLKELQVFRKAISQIKFSDAFVSELTDQFRKVLGAEMGEIPVFIRSDTNMEDLKDFTGAGLNLTLFNVVAKETILQGIRDVWASPYTERSFKWRQSYLNNPENVFPSLLIIPSVSVSYSGVMVTKGVSSGRTDDITLAFNRGVGGAVDGQAAESYLLREEGDHVLLTPARETSLRFLPVTGGTKTEFVTFEEPILNEKNISDLRAMASRIKTILPKTPGIETKGPFDIELGILNNEIWLFQVRPFVENKNASGHLYLESLNPVFDEKKYINISQSLSR